MSSGGTSIRRSAPSMTLLEHRRGHQAAVSSRARIGIVDHHHHREARVLHRHHAGEERRCSGARSRRRWPCARCRSCRRRGSPGSRACVAVPPGSVTVCIMRMTSCAISGSSTCLALVALALDEGRRDQLAAVAERRVGLRDLQRRRPTGRSRRTWSAWWCRSSAPGGGSTPDDFAREAAVRALAVAEAAHEVVEVLVRQLGDDLGRADVGALGDHAGGVEHAVVVVVGGAVAAVRHPARVGVERSCPA